MYLPSGSNPTYDKDIKTKGRKLNELGGLEFEVMSYGGSRFCGSILVVFNPSFMEEDGHGILDGEGINGFEGMFDGSHG